MINRLSRHVANEIIRDLRSRSGFGNIFDDLDDFLFNEVRNDIARRIFDAYEDE